MASMRENKANRQAMGCRIKAEEFDFEIMPAN